MAKKKHIMNGQPSDTSRKVLMNCYFGKPSFIKSDGESVDSVRLSLKVPQNDLDPNTAEELFVWQRLRVEFGLLKMTDWDQLNLPGVDGHEVYTCVAEVSGFKRSRTHRIWSFIVSTDVVSVGQALDLWEGDGSVRVTPMGEPKEEPKADAKPDPNQKSLMD